MTSRRYLERQMEAQLGRSPNQEILRVRIRRARSCLRDRSAVADDRPADRFSEP